MHALYILYSQFCSYHFATEKSDTYNNTFQGITCCNKCKRKLTSERRGQSFYQDKMAQTLMCLLFEDFTVIQIEFM